MYEYSTLSALRFGQFFQFAATGKTICECTHKERNLIIYRNVITGKYSRINGFVNVCKVTRTANIRYVKILDRMFESYQQKIEDIANCPF